MSTAIDSYENINQCPAFFSNISFPNRYIHLFMENILEEQLKLIQLFLMQSFNGDRLGKFYKLEKLMKTKFNIYEVDFLFLIEAEIYYFLDFHSKICGY